MEGSAFDRLLAADQARGRTYVDPGWLPPEDSCPELGHLRGEHVRLLGVVAEAQAKLSALVKEAETAEQRRADAVRDAILAGEDPAKVKVTESSKLAIERARRDYEASSEALAIFVQRALVEIEETAPAIEDGVGELMRLAEERRQEARRLLAEADRLAAEPKRLMAWLSRYVTVTDEFSGEQHKRSNLGPIPFSSLDAPMPVQPPELINEMVFGPSEVMEVGSDEILDEEMEAITNATH